MIEEVFRHKHIEENGDIIEIKIMNIPKSQLNTEGISYSLVYIRNGKRLVGYDNFGGHIKNGNIHHKHINEQVIPYEFVDKWRLLEDFNEDVDKVKRGVIK